mgnify:CR=1 FL=1
MVLLLRAIMLTLPESFCACSAAVARSDQETSDGGDMAQYDRLLRRCIDSIVATFQKRVAGRLQDSRSFIIPEEEEQASDTSDFELVSCHTCYVV